MAWCEMTSNGNSPPGEIRWRFWIWNPWWLLGGILFLLTALQYQRSLRATAKAPTLTTL